MKPVYATPADQYIAEHDAAADAWVLTHRAEFHAMTEEAFPLDYRPGVRGSFRKRLEFLTRLEFLNRQCGIRAGFPDYATWSQRTGHGTTQTEAA